MKNQFRNYLKSNTFIYSIYRKLRIYKQILRARNTLDLCFDQFDKKIITDYEFSIRITDRHFNQVRLLESIIIHLSNWNISGSLVECGVYTGGASSFMLKSELRNNKLKKIRSYWGFDSFAGMPHASLKDGNYAAKWLSDLDQNITFDNALDGCLIGTKVNFADIDIVQNYLSETNYPSNQIHLVKGWFQDTLPLYREQIDDIALLRIDGDFYESTKTCLNFLEPNLVTGGVIIIDDYGSFPGCKIAVDEYIEKSTRLSKPIMYDSHQAFIYKIAN